MSIAAIIYLLSGGYKGRKEKLSKKFSEREIISLSEMYRLPEAFIQKVNELEVGHTEKLYMLKGAMFLFREKPLLGDAVDINDPLGLEIGRYLISKGVAIQYTHQRGMMIVRTKKI